MKKYSISIPDANKQGVKISGVNITKNPFKILGSLLLEIDRGGMTSYKVIESDFENCFPIDAKYWSTTDLFCNACNSHIRTYGSMSTGFTEYFEQICFQIGLGYFCVFSKHKIDDTHWKIIIYDGEDKVLNDAVNNFIDSREDKYEFKY
jgi:hypothetical protein